MTLHSQQAARLRLHTNTAIADSTRTENLCATDRPTACCVRMYVFPLSRASLHAAHLLQAQSAGDVGRVMVVLITDGRANISLGRSNEDPDAMGPDAPKPTADQLKVRRASAIVCYSGEQSDARWRVVKFG
jgi:hypothetical protein